MPSAAHPVARSALAERSDFCELCTTTGGTLAWKGALCRVVIVDDPDYPGFCRVILNRHAAEMTDLTTDEQLELMRIVFAVETVVRDVVKPDKINLACLGNVVPHVHWHVIPRFEDDACFPNPVWALTPEQAKTAKANRVTPELLNDYMRALKIALWSH